MKYETGSIHQVHQRLVADGYQISEYTLRIWVKQGILPAAFCGRKAYICYSNVLRILHGGTNDEIIPDSETGIRRID